MDPMGLCILICFGTALFSFTALSGLLALVLKWGGLDFGAEMDDGEPEEQ